jgi:hypothetical protein
MTCQRDEGREQLKDWRGFTREIQYFTGWVAFASGSARWWLFGLDNGHATALMVSGLGLAILAHMGEQRLRTERGKG